MSEQELARRIAYKLDVAGFLNVKGNSLMETGQKIKEAIEVIIKVLHEHKVQP